MENETWYSLHMNENNLKIKLVYLRPVLHIHSIVLNCDW